MSETYIISEHRQQLFKEVEERLHYNAEIYPLGERFEGLPDNLASTVLLDVTKVPGCHYGLRNVFVPIVHELEKKGVTVGDKQVVVMPETAIQVEPSTGNGWVAFSDESNALEYDHFVIMPDGLPQARYRHPNGRDVFIDKTPAHEYASGMPKRLKALLRQNPQRLAEGKKIFVTPNHAISAAEITVNAMSELGLQLVRKIGDLPIRVVVSMGNGASLCALGEYVKTANKGSKVVATESFVFGEGYDKFAALRGLPRYKELYGIDPENEGLMKKFNAYGTNAPIGIELPLQTRAMVGDLIDDYVLFTDVGAIEAFKQLVTSSGFLKNAECLPNYSELPPVLYETYGNSTLANIAAASKYTANGELVIAMAYDGRDKYD